MVPLFAPGQEVAAGTAAAFIVVPDVIVTGIVSEQPIGFATVIVYEPAGSPVKTGLFGWITCEGKPILRVYVKGPPVAGGTAVIDPVFKQEQAGLTVVAELPDNPPTTTVVDAVQLLPDGVVAVTV